jgi:DNA-binding NarL/FixJ family response regulator
MKPIRVLLVDDHWIVRQGLRSVLNGDPAFEVVGEAADGEKALRLVDKQQPDVVLLDLQMPGLGGVDVCQRMGRASPRTAILILTAFFDQSLIDACLRAGARGYLLKDVENLHLKAQLRAVVEGHAALDPRAARVLTEYLQKGEPAPNVLTAREIEILHLMARGLLNREIGAELSITENTVKGHVKEILAKMNARNRVEAVFRARERGLL